LTKRRSGPVLIPEPEWPERWDYEFQLLEWFDHQAWVREENQRRIEEWKERRRKRRRRAA
jgi:hypothetical protein